MNERFFRIRVEGEDYADAGRHAEDLRDALAGALPDATIRTEQADAETQDPHGTLLTIAIAVHSVGLLFDTFKIWKEYNQRARVSVADEKGQPVTLDSAGSSIAES